MTKEQHNPFEEIRKVRIAKAEEAKRTAESVEEGKEKIPELLGKIKDLIIANKNCFETVDRFPDAYEGGGCTMPVAILNAEVPLKDSEEKVGIMIKTAISDYYEPLPACGLKEDVEKIVQKMTKVPRLPNKDQMTEQLLKSDFKQTYLSIKVEDDDYSLLINGDSGCLRSTKAYVSAYDKAHLIFGPGSVSKFSPAWERRANKEDMDRFIEIIDGIVKTPNVKFKGKITRLKFDRF